MTPHRPKIRVVVLSDILAEIGGAEAVAAETIERLDPERFERTIVLYRRIDAELAERIGQGAVIERLRSRGVRVIELGGSNRFDIWSWRPLLRLMRSGQVDILHAHKFGANLWASLLSRVAPVPVVIAHEHSWSFEGRPWRKFADRHLIATRVDALFVVSERDRGKMIEGGFAPAQVHLLSNGIPAPIVTSASQARTELGIAEGALIVGSVGRLEDPKDIDSLLHAHALVRRRKPDAHLVLVGDGPDRERLEELTDRLGLRSSVHFTGFRSHATELAAGFDVAVNSSRSEGTSLAIIEYMALSRPIVATDVGGSASLLADGEAGVLVPAADPKAMSDAIVGLLDDPEHARALGERARLRQLQAYDVATQVTHLQELYEQLMAGSLSGPGAAAKARN